LVALDALGHTIIFKLTMVHLDYAGMYYNYTTYGSRGLDLLPHKDFWVDLPTMMSDLFSHIASNVRGGSSSGTSRRSGYTSLG
jgi:hypothetical protein